MLLVFPFCLWWFFAGEYTFMDLPGGSDGLRTFLLCRRPGFNPWSRKIPWRWLPTPIFLLGEFHGHSSLEGYSLWGCKESDTTEWLTHTHRQEDKEMCKIVPGNSVESVAKVKFRTRWQGSRWMWNTSLSMDTSGIHLQTQTCMQNTSWEWTGVRDQWKRIYRTMQNSAGQRN